MSMVPLHMSTAVHAHLHRLNPEQRAAVLHGDGRVAGPLLIIAGAGSGKTKTLAHRLSHLVLKGADPRRILLMTFSRRAAAEMTRRAERIAGEILGPKAAILTQGLTWTGTFHSIGSRLLREYAPIIGLEPNFTIHDRGDAADLMNLVRHQLGFSNTEKRFPGKRTCLDIYSRAVNAQADLAQVLRAQFAWCADWEAELKALFGHYRRRFRSLFGTWCSDTARPSGAPRATRTVPRRSCILPVVCGRRPDHSPARCR